MKLELNFDPESLEPIEIIFDSPPKKKKTKRPHKGRSLLALMDDYVVLDLETTGLDPLFDSIIEVGIVRVRNGEIIDSFDSLVNPHCDISDFISTLTGITNEQLQSAPDIDTILPAAISFIGNDVVVAHNANFDINFMYDYSARLGLPYFSRDFIDTMRMSRRLFPELGRYRLIDLADFFWIDWR